MCVPLCDSTLPYEPMKSRDPNVNTFHPLQYSSFLVHDAVFAFAHALHDMFVANTWESSGNGSNLFEFKNGDRLLQYLKKVNAFLRMNSNPEYERGLLVLVAR